MSRGRYVPGSAATAWRAAWLALALVAAGCARDPALTVPSTTGPIVVESFTRGLAVNGSSFYSFTVPVPGTVTLTLVSLTVGGVPSSLSISMGLGVPTGTACNAATTPAFVSINPQTTTSVPPRVYCVLVTDLGTLTDPAEFSVNITRPR